MNISGNEITGLADPTTMFIVFGVIISIGVIAGIAWTIYMSIN